MLEEVRIHCVLRGKQAERFRRIKEATGLKYDSQVIQLLINEYALKKLNITSPTTNNASGLLHELARNIDWLLEEAKVKKEGV